MERLKDDTTYSVKAIKAVDVQVILGSWQKQGDCVH
jgi:hypothetical protein